MKSLFLEGLKTARGMIACGCSLNDLDALIAEHEKGTIETTAVAPIVETR